MGNTCCLSPFLTVRPRGPDLDIPAIPPKKTNSSAAPRAGNVHQALDRNGRRTVSMAPRTLGAITLENREQGQASAARRAAISKGGTK